MKYYTETIPPTLAEKLKEKGMLIFIEQEWYPNGMPKAEKDCKQPMTKYSEVFDWLMGKGIRVALHTYPLRKPLAWGYRLWTMDGGIMYDPNPAPEIMRLDCQSTWHETADAAIEKALTLI